MTEAQPTRQDAAAALAEVGIRAQQVRQADSHLRWMLLALLAAYLVVAVLMSLSPHHGSTFAAASWRRSSPRLRWPWSLAFGFAPTAAPGFVFISERSSPSTCGTRSSPLPASRHVSGVRASRATTLESARQSAWSRW